MKENQHPAPGGSSYWRSLAHLSDGPDMRELIGKEFPGYDAEGMVNSSRRRFLKLMGASMALAGVTLSGCRRWPEEKLAPYSTNPRGRIPGVPEQYATAMELAGVAQPLLVTSYDGRPIKIEGNPSHLFSMTVKDKIGAADAFAQASVLEMYDPHRSQRFIDSRQQMKESSWPEFQAFAAKHFADLKTNSATLAILSEATASPSVWDMRRRLAAAFGQAKWYEYEPISWDAELEGSKLAFGKPVRNRLHLEKASRVVLLDADLLGMHPAHVRYAADWAERRRSADVGDMSRVYLAECGFSITGTVTDVRLPVNPSRLYALARAIATKLGVEGISGEEKLSDAETRFAEAAAMDLKSAGPNGVIAGGQALPPIGHALICAINEKIGAVGNTIVYHEDPTGDRPSHAKSIIDLADQIKAGTVNTLLVLGGNPAYDAPADLEFGKLLTQVAMTIRLGLYEDETSKLCRWHLPRAHYLESWGDGRAWDGTAGIIQPLILPLYGGKSVIELLAIIIGDKVTEGYDLVRRTWREQFLKGDDFERAIRRVIEAGVLEGSEFVTLQASVKPSQYPAAQTSEGMYVRFAPGSHTYDGRFANNGWLQETPDPLTKLVWDNAALIAKKDADAAGVTTGDLIHIDAPPGRSIEIPAYVMPGQPVGVITLPLGQGRTSAGPIGDGVGFDCYQLRSSQAPDVVAGAKIRAASGTYRLVATQDHHILDSIGVGGREKRVGGKGESGIIIREATLAEFKSDPNSVHGGPRKIELQLFEAPSDYTDTHAWAMSVDLNSCIGCNACALACQAENNIPIVGKIEAYNHREMNWIRIDRYFKGDADDPTIEVVHQPMMCQQCENAPCEQVCPVGATVHDSEGLNTMVYNRCIGTRYCSNNCPYKVRRFNYFDYHSKDPRSNWGTPWPFFPDSQQYNTVPKIEQMVFNPDVSLRMRGVMEKCTYCVQRIHRATIAKRGQGEDVTDGDIITACQQACPTQAIVFGDLNDPESKVSKLHKNQRSYGVLSEELNTRPRTKYLAKIRNPVEAGHEVKA